MENDERLRVAIIASKQFTVRDHVCVAQYNIIRCQPMDLQRNKNEELACWDLTGRTSKASDLVYVDPHIKHYIN